MKSTELKNEFSGLVSQQYELTLAKHHAINAHKMIKLDLIDVILVELDTARLNGKKRIAELGKIIGDEISDSIRSAVAAHYPDSQKN